MASKKDADYPQDLTARNANPTSKDRIVEAAYKCFNKYGIRKTTIEDIAERAKVSRPTFYTYFNGKDDVVDYIRQLELLRVGQQIRARLRKYANFAEALTESLIIAVSVARENAYIRTMIESPSTVSKAAQPDSTGQRLHLEHWSPMLNRAREQGELAADLNLDEIVSWLTLAQQLLLTKIDAAQVPEAELRVFVRRFIVAPLLSPEHAAD